MGFWGKNWFFSGTEGPDWSWSYFDRAFLKKNLQIYILPSPVPTYGRSCPSILEHQDHKGSPRTSQDQSYMILAFLHPQTFSKTAPTCVRSSPGILEPPGPQRITQDQPGPVLHDPCLSSSSDLFKNTSYLCPVRSWDSRVTRTTKNHPGPTRTSPTWSLPFFILRPFQKHLLPVSGPILGF